MKKIQQRLFALVMAGVMLISYMYTYAYVTAEATASDAAPVIGDRLNLVCLDDTAFLAAGTNYGPLDLSQTVKGDTWYLSVTVNFSKAAAWEGPELAFATGTVTQTGADDTPSVAEDQMIRVQIRNTDKAVGQYLLNRAAEPMYTPGNTVLSGEVGFSFEEDKDYRVTIAISERDKLSLWVDDAKLISGQSLAALGITDLQPCIGWRCYISAGTMKRIQVWDDMSEKPTFDETTERDVSPVCELSLEAPNGYAEKALEGIRFGSRYHLSGRVNAENTQSDGSMRFAVAEIPGGTVSVGLQPGVQNGVSVLVNNGSSAAQTLYTTKLPSWVNMREIYTYTAVYENGTLSFYVDNVLAVNRLKLGETVTPRVGLCADRCRGEVTDIRLWGDVYAAPEKPTFDAAKDDNSAILTELPVSAAKAFDPVLFEGITYADTYAYSGAARVTETESGEDYSIGMILGTAVFRGKPAYIEVRFQPARKHAQLLLHTANAETVLQDTALDGSLTSAVNYTALYDRGSVSFWIGDTLIFGRENIKAVDGVTGVCPQAGVCATQCSGRLSSIKIWGEAEKDDRVLYQKVSDIAPYRTLGDRHASLADIADAVFYSGNNKEAVELSQAVRGNTWYLGLTVNFSAADEERGPELAFATGTVGGVQKLIRLQIRKSKDGTVGYVLNCAKAPMFTFQEDVPAVGGSGTAFTLGRDYRVTIEVADGDKLSFWLDDKKVIDGLSLSEKGITALSPCFGWRNYNAAGAFTDIQVWDETGRFAAPETAGYIFAGWYQDAEGTLAVEETAESGSAYAKLVPEKVLSVKAQLAADTALTTAKTSLRFITTVDSVWYQQIGFDITVAGKRTVNCPGTKVYKTIEAIGSLGSVSYTPEVFHTASAYFYAYTITNIPIGAYSTDIQVSPYWITPDGTKVVGVTRTICVKDGCLVASSKEPITEVFHDPSDEYISPPEPKKTEAVTLRLRTQRDTVTVAKIQYTNNAGTTWNTVNMKFAGHDSTGYYDYFSGTVPAQSGMFYYRFICSNDAYTVYLDRRLKLTAVGSSYENCWVVNPGYSTPDWSKGALWYSLIPDSFYNGDTSNDLLTSVSSRNQDRLGLGDRYGGDLAGITEKIDHIKSLYADAVYMNPIFKSNQSIGYGQVDYMQIEPSFGNAADLLKMCNSLHASKLKVMMDAVIHFSPWDSLYLDNSRRYPLDGESESADSAFAGMYMPGKNGEKYLDSGWNGPVINNSSEIAKKLFYTLPNSFLRYYPAQFGIDGWRFDLGGDLTGVTADGTTEGSGTIMSHIRPYVKGDNPDTLLVSEYSGDADLMGNSWDSRWNNHLLQCMRKYAAGTLGESDMSSTLKSAVDRFPRPVALSMYNAVTTHDYTRLDIEDPYMEKAMLLMQMNYLGSPCIYYGDEIGLGAQENTSLGSVHYMSAMDWDESQWDHARYNFYRALGELRTKYSAVKTGAIREMLVSDERNLYAYGRFDKNGTVITVSSQNAETVTVDLDARKLGVADGASFTDWLTGKQYAVDENGLLHAEVMPGGSVFVSGSEPGSYYREYTVSSMGDASGEVCLQPDGTYVLRGKGSLSDADTLTLATGNLYGAGSVYGVVKGDGKALLTMRQSGQADAAAYNVSIEGNRLEITARKKAGGKLETVCSTTFTRGNAVRIERDADNCFYVSVAEISYSGNILGDWTRIGGSGATLSVGRNVLAGFAPLSGGTQLKHVQPESGTDAVLAETFENGNGSALLIDLPQKNATVSGGKLTLDGRTARTRVTTVGKEDDWTFRTALYSTAKEGAYAGILCAGGNGQFVATGRTVLNGKAVLYIGHTTDGSMQVDAYIEDANPHDAVILQLQRIGSAYTAVASYDGVTWKSIGGSVSANYSSEYPGVFAEGMQATFDYVCFGDSVHDGKSVNTPHAEGVVDMDYSATVAAQARESTVILSGSWEYGEQGYYQINATGKARLALNNKVYEDVRINVTLKPEEGIGYTAVGFGKKFCASADEDGFLLKYTADEELVLLKSGALLQQVKAPTANETGLRIVVETTDGDICIYAGDNSACLMRVRDSGYTEGFVVFETNDRKAGFCNSSVSSTDASFDVLTGTVSGGASTVTVTGNGNTYGAATRRGVGVTDFVMTSTVRIGGKTNADGPDAEGGILFGAPAGASAAKRGISVSLVSGGILRLKADGVTVREQALGGDVTYAVLMIARKDNLIRVYVQGREDAVLTYTDSVIRGGAVQVYGINTTANFTNLGLEDIAGREITAATLYGQWQQNTLPCTVKDYRENFSDLSGWKYLTRYHADHGTWRIENGVLSCTASTGWASGVTVYDSVYNDFQMDFRYRFNESGGTFAGVLFDKQTISDTNNQAKYSLLLYSSGLVVLSNSGGAFLKTATIGSFKVGSWYTLRLSCLGDTISVYSGEQLLFSYTDSNVAGSQGFISLTSNKCMISFDDVAIYKLPMDSGGKLTGEETGDGDIGNWDDWNS